MRMLLAMATCLLVVNGAWAAKAGHYECKMSKAFVVNADGRTHPMDAAPTTFRLEIANAPVTGSELGRSGPHRALDNRLTQEPTLAQEPTDVWSASILTPLFASSVMSMRSTDGSLFTQLGNTFRIDSDGSFLAFGLAQTGREEGIAVLSGRCTSMS